MKPMPDFYHLTKNIFLHNYALEGNWRFRDFGLSFCLDFAEFTCWLFGFEIHKQIPWNFLTIHCAFGPLQLYIEIVKPENNQRVEKDA